MSTDDWCTPHVVDVCLYDFFGGPADLDPCSNNRSIMRARKALTAGGLHLPWRKKTYSNPPYSQMLPWVEKGVREMTLDPKTAKARAHCEELVTLWPVAPSTIWWKRAVGLEPIPAMVKGGREITAMNPTLIFTKRLAFIDESGQAVSGCRFDSVLFFYGAKERRHKDFLHAFAPLINWSTRGR